MELSTRQIIVLAAPLVVTYLTWSTVSGGVKVMSAARAAQKLTTGDSKSAKAALDAALSRNPFAPVAGGGLLSALGNLEDEGAEEEEGENPLRLDGTVITSRWRFAIINGERVVEGQTYRGLKVEKIDADRVALNGELGRVILDLEIAKVTAPGAPGSSPTETETPGLSAVEPGHAPDVFELLGIPRS